MSNWQGNNTYNRPQEAWSNQDANHAQPNNRHAWAPNYAPPASKPNHNKKSLGDQNPGGYSGGNTGNRWRDMHDEVLATVVVANVVALTTPTILTVEVGIRQTHGGRPGRSD